MFPLLHRLRARPQPARRPVGLALQGGGSWGAYTWGVLDVMLASRRVAVAQLSGTSAGAINAAIVAGALANGSPARARRGLASFWRRIAAPSLPLSAPVERVWHDSVGLWLLASSVVSPYQANPLGIHPLRAALEAHVDIEAVRSGAAPPLFVTLTNVKTGLPRVISNAEMTIEALLASACVPQLFQAIEIDGEPYWDGGYLGNPTLGPMIRSGAARDLVVVQLVPDGPEDAPRDALSIRRRVGEIVFNASLVAEMRAIATMRDTADSPRAPVRDLRLHRIGPPRRDVLQQGSALERSALWLERLRAEGRAAAKAFLVRHGADLGVRETLDVAATFTDARNDGGAAANEPVYATER
jgi:NTE family protein